MRVPVRAAVLVMGAGAAVGIAAAGGGVLAAIRSLPPGLAAAAWAVGVLALALMVVMALVVRKAVREQKQQTRGERLRRDLLRAVAQYERSREPWLENT